MDTRPEQPPEGRLIADAADRLDLSIREAARRAGISYGRWRQITVGYQNVSPGSFAAVRAPAKTLAKMAKVVGVNSAQLADVGREDAAVHLAMLTPAEPATPEPQAVTPDSGDDVTTAVVAALFGQKERRIWVQVRRRLEATPDGAALFGDPAQARTWPADSAPFDLTPEAREVLDATPANALFDATAERVVWNLDKLPYRKRVEMIREYREPVRGAGTARRAGLKKPSTLSALSS
jgi:hypothetical protein